MVPKRLQAVLWSVSTDKLDVEKDKHYIIHQVLAYGRWEDVVWLFNIYDKETIRREFIEHPEKDYQLSTFNFVKNHLLGLEHVELDKTRYDTTTPRYIGH